MTNPLPPNDPPGPPPADPGREAAYREGFLDGRASLAKAVAVRLHGHVDEAMLSECLDMPVDRIHAMAATEAPCPPDPDARGESADPAHAHGRLTGGTSFNLIRETPTPGTAWVEPGFVRLVRQVNHLTQTELAAQLGVHERTVCVWETAAKPVRLRTATYEKLVRLSDPRQPSRVEGKG